MQQSPDEATARSARLGIAQLSVGSCSPKSLASESQVAASSMSLDDRPLGTWVVQRMKVVLKTWERVRGQREERERSTKKANPTLDHSGW